ncbi:unnamed protein product [Ilex paraguariensis]|uniref:Uncharacterized protein n=1 Tax=Ilex paraguariensis TaxID=185542 RepID=A0ABC8UYB5_9AQUA
MEQTEGIGIKIYNATPQDDGHVAGNDVPLQTEYRRPFRTLLTFEMVIPSTYHNGECTPVSTMMIHVQLVLCSLSCLFFHFTDSFHGPNGKVYYGFVTSQSLEVFKLGVTVEVPKEERFTLSFTDCACNHIGDDVDSCKSVPVFPGYEKDMDEAMESFPLMTGIVYSDLFFVFPNTRYGIGCMAT